jgi:hypothetical protein
LIYTNKILCRFDKLTIGDGNNDVKQYDSKISMTEDNYILRGEKMKVDKEKIFQSFQFWCKKLRVSPHWDIQLEFVEDIDWKKTGDLR